jgi:hypothetical protein
MMSRDSAHYTKKPQTPGLKLPKAILSPDRQQPTANSQQPTANSQQPTANSQQPTANSQQPTANSQLYNPVKQPSQLATSRYLSFSWRNAVCPLVSTKVGRWLFLSSQNNIRSFK